MTAITVLTPSPPPVSGDGSDFIQTGGTDQFGDPMPPNGATYTVTSGHGTVTASTDPPGFCFHAPTGITAPETDTILMTDGTFTKTITISVTPGAAGGHWGTVNDLPQYQPVVSPQGTVVVTDPTGATNTFPWIVSGSGEAYGASSATVDPGQSASVTVSGSASFAFTWMPAASGSSPPSTSVFLFSASASADYILAGSASADDGLGDQEQDGLGDSIPPQQEANSQGVHLKSVSTTSGTATIKVSSLTSTGQCAPPSGSPYGGYTFGAGASVTLPQPVDVDVSVASPYSGDVVPAGQDVTITATAYPLAGNNSACPLQSLTVKAQGGSGGDPTLVSFDASTGRATFLLSSPSAGTYTLVAEAMYDDSSGTPTEVDSMPVTFSVASFTVKTNSWNPNPAYVGQIISGQVQGKFDPSSIDGGGSGQTFVVYTWSTAGVWYSPDGTAGTFEPCGSYAIGWQQGQADTTFSAQFFAPGQYLLEVSCVATVYSQSTGSLVASFSGTGYIGGSASDIDTSGGTGQAHKAHALKAHAGGGAGITVVPATVTFSDSSIKLGLGSPQNYFKQITATVTPGNQAGSVSFVALNTFGGPSNEVSISLASENLATGQVQLYVTAASPTPSTTGGSPDCFVSATVPNYVGVTTLASASALVLVPSGCTETPATSTQDSVTNMCFAYNQQTPPDWNIGTEKDYIEFATQARKDITITIKDQFGQALDTMYDGYHIVDEVVTGDENKNGPIDFPNGTLSKGVITDEIQVSTREAVPTSVKGLTDYETAWKAEKATLPDANKKPYYNNAFAYPPPTLSPKTTQTLSIGGYTLSPAWERDETINAINLPGTIMTVNITPIPGT